VHPAADRFPSLWGDRAAFAQAAWRHALFGALLGAAEARLNPPVDDVPAEPEAPVASANGHRDVQHLTVVAPT
jgi:hypothetical protein